MGTNGLVKGALGYLNANYEGFKRTLVELSRIPSVSADGFPPEEVRRQVIERIVALEDVVNILEEEDKRQELVLQRVDKQILENHLAVQERAEGVRAAFDAELSELRQTGDQRMERYVGRFQQIEDRLREMEQRLTELPARFDALVARELLDRGIDVNQRYPGEQTALMWAAGFNHRETAELLLARGADPALRDDRGWTAAQQARANGHEAIAARLDQQQTR